MPQATNELSLIGLLRSLRGAIHCRLLHSLSRIRSIYQSYWCSFILATLRYTRGEEEDIDHRKATPWSLKYQWSRVP